MYANVRETGTEISWHGCDFTEAAAEDEAGFLEFTCNTLDDLDEMNCKRFSSEKSKYGRNRIQVTVTVRAVTMTIGYSDSFFGHKKGPFLLKII